VDVAELEECGRGAEDRHAATIGSDEVGQGRRSYKQVVTASGRLGEQGMGRPCVDQGERGARGQEEVGEKGTRGHGRGEAVRPSTESGRVVTRQTNIFLLADSKLRANR